MGPKGCPHPALARVIGCWALGKRLPSTKHQLFIHKLAQKITQEGAAPLPSSWLCSKTQDREMDSQPKLPYNYWSGIT